MSNSLFKKAILIFVELLFFTIETFLPYRFYIILSRAKYNFMNKK